MANVKFIAVSRGLRGIVDYVTNREKTVEQLISGVNCVARTAVPEFEAVKKQFRKTEGRGYYHIVQAFAPDDPLGFTTAHELYFRLGGADYLQACRKIAYDHREPTPTLEDAVCGMAGTVAAICALCEDEDSEVSDLARELYYSSLLLQELVEWYQSRRQEQENYEEEYEQYHGFDMTMM